MTSRGELLEEIARENWERGTSTIGWEAEDDDWEHCLDSTQREGVRESHLGGSNLRTKRYPTCSGVYEDGQGEACVKHDEGVLYRNPGLTTFLLGCRVTSKKLRVRGVWTWWPSWISAFALLFSWKVRLIMCPTQEFKLPVNSVHQSAVEVWRARHSREGSSSVRLRGFGARLLAHRVWRRWLSNNTDEF